MHGLERRVLVVGHLRLESALRNLSPTAPAEQEIIRDATLSAFEYLVEAAVEQAVDAVLLVGDVLGESPSPRACASFRDGMEIWLEAGVRVLWAVRNSQEPRLLAALQCLPAGVQLLDAEQPRRVLLESSETTHTNASPRAVQLECLWWDSTLSREHKQNQNQPYSADVRSVRIGITTRAASLQAAELSENAIHAADLSLLLFGNPERRQTERQGRCLKHAPGTIQGTDDQIRGACSATLLRVDAEGQIDPLTLETTQVRREQLELTCEPRESLNALLQRADQELRDLLNEVHEGPTRLLHLEWQIRGPLERFQDWSSELLQTELAKRWQTSKQGVGLNHHVQFIPLMSGEVVASETLTEEHLPEQFLQHLSQHLTRWDGRQEADLLAPHSRGKQGGPNAPWAGILAELSPRAIGHRAGELGAQALQEKKLRVEG